MFLHGFNCCLADACKTLAQFLALANLPPHIRPFLFSWPTGTFHNYITAIKRGAQGDQTQLDFVGELQSWQQTCHDPQLEYGHASAIHCMAMHWTQKQPSACRCLAGCLTCAWVRS